MKHIMDFFKDECGQGMVEYALIISLVSVVAVGALIYFGLRVKKLYEFEVPTETTS